MEDPDKVSEIQGYRKQSQKKSVFDARSQRYFLKLLQMNGKNLSGFQTSHVMVVYFIIQGLASSNCLNHVDKQLIVKYIKSLQLPEGGFTSSSLYTSFNQKNEFSLPHIVFTYSAVNVLTNLGSLKEISKQKCIASVKACLKQNGSFSNFSNSNEADLRFVYAALCVLKAFEDFSCINKQKVKKYIDSCYNYDGGYGLRPYCESHSGAIYCAVASYTLIDYDVPNRAETLEFLVDRQSANESIYFCKKEDDLVGVQGRVGKIPDSCYTFWVGASIKILTGENLLNDKIENFLRLCYNEESFNFSKYPNMKGDPLHTLHSTVGLKILNSQDQNVNIIQGLTITNNNH